MGLPKIDGAVPTVQNSLVLMSGRHHRQTLNPLDYCIRGTLEPIVNAKQHRSLEVMKRTLIRE